MREDWEERVRERAYAIRERERRPEAGAERHWGEVEREPRADAEAGIGRDARTTGGFALSRPARESLSRVARPRRTAVRHPRCRAERGGA